MYTQHPLHVYGIQLTGWAEMTRLDALIFAVNPRFYLDQPRDELLQRLRPDGVLVDIKSVLDPQSLPQGLHHWSL